MNHTDIFRTQLLALGFRLFFLLAGMSGAALIVFRDAAFNGVPDNYYPPVLWHAHEMIFGYTTAVIAGFLLTAVRNWTGRDTARGGRLAALGLCWFYGRVLPFYAGLLPGWLIAAVDLAFLPWLAVEVGRPVVQAGGSLKNLVFALLLAVMTTGNLLVHGDILGVTEIDGVWGVRLALDAILVIILVIAGRIFPFFTERAVRGAKPLRRPALEAASLATALALFLLEAVSAPALLIAAAALAAAWCNALRLRGWHHSGVWRLPLLWVLYLGYGWLIVGFVLAGAAAFQLFAPSLALHAYTVGAIGVLTVGMMSRVSLGHTGRALVPDGAVVTAFVLINLAAVVRVLGGLSWPAQYADWLRLSTALWFVAFALFLAVFLPIWSGPRADGKPD